MDEGILEVEELAEDRVIVLHVVELITCEREGIVGDDEGPVGGVAQVIGYHGVTVVVCHQEKGQEEEVEKQGEVEGEKEEEQLKDDDTWMECGWSDKCERP